PAGPFARAGTAGPTREAPTCAAGPAHATPGTGPVARASGAGPAREPGAVVRNGTAGPVRADTASPSDDLADAREAFAQETFALLADEPAPRAPRSAAPEAAPARTH